MLYSFCLDRPPSYHLESYSQTGPYQEQSPISRLQLQTALSNRIAAGSNQSDFAYMKNSNKPVKLDHMYGNRKSQALVNLHSYEPLVQTVPYRSSGRDSTSDAILSGPATIANTSVDAFSKESACQSSAFVQIRKVHDIPVINRNEKQTGISETGYDDRESILHV